MSDDTKGFIACVGLALCLLATAASWPLLKIGGLFAEIDFGEADYFDWIVSAFIICEVAMIPVAGKIIDHIGLRRVALFGVVMFSCFSLMCSACEEDRLLAAFRGFQGIGAAFCFASAFAGPGLLFPHGERGTQHGLMTAAFAVASLFGTAAGVYICSKLDWQHLFYIPASVALAGGCILALTLPRSGQIKGDFDFPGAAVMFVTLFVGMYYTQFVNNTFEMFSLESALILGFIPLLVLALIHREREAVNPIFPRSLRGVNLKIVLAILLIASFVLGLLQFYVEIYVLEYCDLTDIESFKTYLYKGSGMFVFLLIGGAMTSLPGGHIVPHTGARPWVMFGFVMTTLGLILTALFVDKGVGYMALCLFVLGTGLGSMVTLLLISLQGLTPREEMGSVSAFTMGMRVVAIAAGLSIYTDYAHSRLVNYFQNISIDIGHPHSFIELIEAILGLVSDIFDGAVDVTVTSFATCALVAVAFCFVGFLLTCAAGSADKGLCPPREKKKLFGNPPLSK